MKDIGGDDRSVQELLSGGSYTIDYYQREYKWRRKQIEELVADLTGRFLEFWSEGDEPQAVAKYGFYFLGSIVVSQSGETRAIVDGQQRLTSLTLLLIFLNNLQKARADAVSVSGLLFADDFGQKNFRLNIPERTPCMEALFNGTPIAPEGQSESVQTLIARYGDIEEIFSAELEGQALPLFVYWLTRKVKLIEIVAYSDEDAYTIFETMNDRGLSLTATDMLKGYLLANIDDAAARFQADTEMKKQLARLMEWNRTGDQDSARSVDADFFKAWLRSRYATTIRDRKKDTRNQDYELIGTEYHRWVRAHAAEIGLHKGADFRRFAADEMRFYADLYILLLEASETRIPGLASVRYNADAGFTLQYQIILAVVSPGDDRASAVAKMGVVADFIDCWLNLRLWNYRSNSYSAMNYASFTIIREIRGQSIEVIRARLRARLEAEMAEIGFSKPVTLNQFTAKAIHRQLARFTDWIEERSGEPGHYEDYIVRSGKNAFEIEHIWANHPARFAGAGLSAEAFRAMRDQIGGLLLLPKKVNASLSDMTYAEKRPHYLKATALAQSLHPDFYERNPGFRQVLTMAGLPFRPHEDFAPEDLRTRSDLYCRLAALMWSPDRVGPAPEASAPALSQVPS